MSNHYHVVLHVDAGAAAAWSTAEVVRRWHRIFAGNPLTRKLDRGDALLPAERTLVEEIAAEWRARLTNISWFMRSLNEEIARKANAEDQCTGRFWEGRFKSQALLDDEALAPCLVYVDLNLVRAGIAQAPEGSDYTSIQDRARAAQKAHAPDDPAQQPSRLLPFVGNPRKEMPIGLPFRLTDQPLTERLGGQNSCRQGFSFSCRLTSSPPRPFAPQAPQRPSPLCSLVSSLIRPRPTPQQHHVRAHFHFPQTLPSSAAAGHRLVPALWVSR